jgi:hypothetical protein
MASVDFTKNQICWTTTPYTQGALSELPFVEMYGHEQTWSAVIGNINAWMARFNDAKEGGNPYKGLYVGDLKSVYVLPYFNEYHHAITQGWGAGQGPVGEMTKKLTDFAETLAKVVLPAAGILVPQSYEGGTPGTYSFSFNLINTNAGVGSDGTIRTNIEKNKQFLESFIKDNLHGMNGCLSVTPPLIYEIYIPGVRWSPAAVVSGLTVNNKGMMNLNRNGLIPGLPANYIYPDAWEVTVAVTELINESKTIYNDAITDSAGVVVGSKLTTRVFD